VRVRLVMDKDEMSHNTLSFDVEAEAMGASLCPCTCSCERRLTWRAGKGLK